MAHLETSCSPAHSGGPWPGCSAVPVPRKSTLVPCIRCWCTGGWIIAGGSLQSMEPSIPGMEPTHRCQLCASPSNPPPTAVVNLPQRGWWEGLVCWRPWHTQPGGRHRRKGKSKGGGGGKKERRKGENPPHREYLSQRNPRCYKSELFPFLAFPHPSTHLTKHRTIPLRVGTPLFPIVLPAFPSWIMFSLLKGNKN